MSRRVTRAVGTPSEVNNDLLHPPLIQSIQIMPVELRKRKAVAQPAVPAKQPKKSKVDSIATKVTKAATSGEAAPTEKPANATSSKPSVGKTLNLAEFDFAIATNDDEPTTLQKLLSASKSGIVLFTYPRASTPGCTMQACLFRDSYTPLTATGLSIFGLSNDSPKANTTFKTKKELPYPLLCDVKGELIKALGFGKAGKGTVRGVVAIGRDGKVLCWEAAGPAKTVDVVKALVEGMPSAKEEKKAADVAAEVANTAEVLDEKEEGVSSARKEATVAAEVADTAEVLDGEETAKK